MASQAGAFQSPSYLSEHAELFLQSSNRARGHGRHWSLSLPSLPERQESLFQTSHLLSHGMSYTVCAQEDRDRPSELSFAFFPWEQLSQLSFRLVVSRSTLPDQPQGRVACSPELLHIHSGRVELFPLPSYSFFLTCRIHSAVISEPMSFQKGLEVTWAVTQKEFPVGLVPGVPSMKSLLGAHRGHI